MEPRDHGLEYEEDVRPQPRLTRPCAAWRRESRRLPVNRGEITTRSGRHQTSGGSWQRQNRPRRSATKPQSDGLLVTRAWLGSRWCMKELNLAHRLNKRLFGVLIEDVPIAELPPDLTSTWQLVNLAAGSDHQLFRALMPDKRMSPSPRAASPASKAGSPRPASTLDFLLGHQPTSQTGPLPRAQAASSLSGLTDDSDIR